MKDIDFSGDRNLLPIHFPRLQCSVIAHTPFSPHLHCPAVHVSDTPAHLAFVPQWQMLDLHVSEEFDAPEQSSSVMHSDVIGIW